MDSEEQIFDFMAAAEDTGKRLDEMAKRLPGELRTVLVEEWRRSPWLAELPKAIGEARETTKQTEAATRFLARTIRIAGIVVCLASVVIPLATWGVAYLNVSDLRRERLRLERENDDLGTAIEAKAQAGRDEVFRQEAVVQRLSATAEVLKAELGGGIELVDNGGGSWVLTLPAGIKLERPWRDTDGRSVIPYAVSGK